MTIIPPRFNLARACLQRQTRETPDKLGLMVIGDASDVAGAERWTYAELDRAVRSIASGLLAQGLKRGDRVLLQLPNNSDYALLFFGAMAAGLVPVPISAQLRTTTPRVFISPSISRHPAVVACWPVPNA